MRPTQGSRHVEKSNRSRNSEADSGIYEQMIQLLIYAHITVEHG